MVLKYVFRGNGWPGSVEFDSLVTFPSSEVYFIFNSERVEEMYSLHVIAENTSLMLHSWKMLLRASCIDIENLSLRVSIPP